MPRLSLNPQLHHHLLGLGLLDCSDLPVRRIQLSISLSVNLCLFLHWGGNGVSSENFNALEYSYEVSIVMLKVMKTQQLRISLCKKYMFRALDLERWPRSV